MPTGMNTYCRLLTMANVRLFWNLQLLIDFQGNPVVSGDNPWELQEQSKAWVENYNSGTGGVIIKVGATSLLAGAIVGGSLAAMMTTSAFVAVSAGGVATVVAACDCHCTAGSGH